MIDEPIVIMAVWNWLDKQRVSLLECLRHRIGEHAPRENGFEAYLIIYLRKVSYHLSVQAYLIIYLRKVFEKATRLHDIFTFRSDFANRKDLEGKFELVVVSTTAGTNEQTWKVSLVTPSSGPSSNVGLKAKDDDSVVGWISKNEEYYAFCFPTESAGPDVLFFLRNEATEQLLLVAMQAKNYQTVGKQILIQGVDTVTLPFWKTQSKDKKVSST